MIGSISLRHLYNIVVCTGTTLLSLIKNLLRTTRASYANLLYNLVTKSINHPKLNCKLILTLRHTLPLFLPFLHYLKFDFVGLRMENRKNIIKRL